MAELGEGGAGIINTQWISNSFLLNILMNLDVYSLEPIFAQRINDS